MNRNHVILVLLAIALAVAAYMVLQRPGEIGASGSTAAPLVTYDSSAVDKMEIHSSLGEVVLEKQAGKWMVVKPVRYLASEEAVTSALGKGRSITLASMVSSNPEKQSMFMVDSSGTLVRMYEKENERAAFWIGKPSSTFRENYVRREGSNEVFLATELLTPSFARRLDEWREKKIFSMEKESITSVGFRYGDTTFTLALEDSIWRIGTQTAQEAAVTSFLGALTTFSTDDFVDSAISSPPRITATIEVGGTQIRFHFDKDTEKYHVQTSASPQWFDVQSWRVNQLLKRKKDFLATGT